ncbi:MAG: hypothetical protein RLZZ491_1642 [Pseudomonadota bacterium]
MIKLRETSAFAGYVFPKHGLDLAIRAIPSVCITSVSPWPGQGAILRSQLGGFPDPGEVIHLGHLRLVWAGRETAFVFGAPPPTDLQSCCAVCDQSDGWAGIEIAGAGAEAFLTRRLPFDLRKLRAPGSARSLLGHLPILVVRTDQASFELWFWRSMTASLLHELDIKEIN